MIDGASRGVGRNPSTRACRGLTVLAVAAALAGCTAAGHDPATEPAVMGAAGRSHVAGDQAMRDPVSALPYRSASRPVIDYSQSVGYDADDQDADDGVTTSYSLLATGDVAYHTGEVFLRGDEEDGLERIRVGLHRTDHDGDLLGPLGAVEYDLGDVFIPGVPLLTDGGFGSGVSVSSFPVGDRAEPDRVTLEGTVQPGTDVELFRNGVLQDIQRAGDDGRYVFDRVELLPGRNVMRLVLSGPQGQQEERTETVFRSPSRAPVGTVNYRVSVLRSDETMLRALEDFGDDDDTTLDATDGELVALADAEFGFNRRWSVTAGLASLPLDRGDGESERRDYASMGARGIAGPVLMQVDAASDTRGGMAQRVNANTTVLGYGVTVDHREVDGFVSDDVDSRGLTRDTEIRLDGTVPSPLSPPASVALTGSHEQFDDGRHRYRMGSRYSATLAGVGATTGIDADYRTDGPDDGLVLDGSTAVSGRVLGIDLRGLADYDLDPTREVTRLELTAQHRLSSDLLLQGRAWRDFEEDEETTLSFDLVRDFRAFSLGGGAAADDRGGFGVTVSLAASLYPDPWTGGYRADRRSSAGSGAVAPRMFLDRDRDGTFGHGDRPIPGARIRVDGRGAPQPTGDDGIAMVAGLPVDRPSTVMLLADTLQDPAWTPVLPSVRVVPREGAVVPVDLPVVATGRIAGVVQGPVGQILREIADVTVELVAASGAVADTTRSAGDGGYRFRSVRPGRYTVRVARQDLAMLGVTATAQTVEVPADGASLRRDLNLRPAMPPR